MQKGGDERTKREDARERVEHVFQPTQDPLPDRLFLLHLHLFQVGDERGKVALQLYDVLRKRTGCLGDVVGEPCRVRVANQSFEPRLGRSVNPQRHHMREMDMATENLVGRLRTPARGFSQQSDMMSDLPLSLVRLLRADSTTQTNRFNEFRDNRAEE